MARLKTCVLLVLTLYICVNKVIGHSQAHFGGPKDPMRNEVEIYDLLKIK